MSPAAFLDRPSLGEKELEADDREEQGEEVAEDLDDDIRGGFHLL